MATKSAMKTCICCGKTFTPDKFHPYQRFCSKRCKWRRHSANGRKLKRYHELRFEAVEALGGKCAICGINDMYMLTIDHIYGDWEKDPFSRRNERALHKYILRDAESAKRRFQVLCWNHNSMKALYPEVFAERYSVAR
ncbi:MAG: hypothetical protein ACUVUF_04645 [Candidatus Bathycorpusculaceae bacterium]